MTADPQQSPAGELSAAGGLHTYELTIWECAKHGVFYPTIRAPNEVESCSATLSSAPKARH